ncbi:MAG: LysM peptidoglycan-binding domain-containing protein [Verrucomicrobiia bacterium]
MNTPNPLVPQGALEKQSKGRSTVHIAILTIVSIHAVFFAGLLMQGCRRDETKTAALQPAEAVTNENENTLPPLDDEYYPPTAESAQSSSPLPQSTPIVQQQPEESTPAVLPQAVHEPPAEGRSYTIVKGDTFAAIAKANSVKLDALKKANPTLNPNRLKPGTPIQIPAATAAKEPSFGSADSSKPMASVTSGKTHRVKRGETLARIARRYGVSVPAIRTANSLPSDLIRAGQKLTIPEKSKDGEPRLTATASTQVAARGYAR